MKKIFLQNDPNICCISIPINCFNKNPQTLKDININTKEGREYYRAVQFMIRTMHNINIGSSKGTYYFNDQCEDNNLSPKFTTIIEPLIENPIGQPEINIDNDEDDTTTSNNIDLSFHEHIIGKKELYNNTNLLKMVKNNKSTDNEKTTNIDENNDIMDCDNLISDLHTLHIEENYEKSVAAFEKLKTPYYNYEYEKDKKQEEMILNFWKEFKKENPDLYDYSILGYDIDNNDNDMMQNDDDDDFETIYTPNIKKKINIREVLNQDNLAGIRIIWVVQDPNFDIMTAIQSIIYSNTHKIVGKYIQTFSKRSTFINTRDLPNIDVYNSASTALKGGEYISSISFKKHIDDDNNNPIPRKISSIVKTNKVLVEIRDNNNNDDLEDDLDNILNNESEEEENESNTGKLGLVAQLAKKNEIQRKNNDSNGEEENNNRKSNAQNGSFDNNDDEDDDDDEHKILRPTFTEAFSSLNKLGHIEDENIFFQTICTPYHFAEDIVNLLIPRHVKTYRIDTRNKGSFLDENFNFHDTSSSFHFRNWTLSGFCAWNLNFKKVCDVQSTYGNYFKTTATNNNASLLKDNTFGLSNFEISKQTKSFNSGFPCSFELPFNDIPSLFLTPEESTWENILTVDFPWVDKSRFEKIYNFLSVCYTDLIKLKNDKKMKEITLRNIQQQQQNLIENNNNMIIQVKDYTYLKKINDKKKTFGWKSNISNSKSLLSNHKLTRKTKPKLINHPSVFNKEISNTITNTNNLDILGNVEDSYIIKSDTIALPNDKYEENVIHNEDAFEVLRASNVSNYKKYVFLVGVDEFEKYTAEILESYLESSVIKYNNTLNHANDISDPMKAIRDWINEKKITVSVLDTLDPSLGRIGSMYGILFLLGKYVMKQADPSHIYDIICGIFGVYSIPTTDKERLGSPAKINFGNIGGPSVSKSFSTASSKSICIPDTVKLLTSQTPSTLKYNTHNNDVVLVLDDGFSAGADTKFKSKSEQEFANNLKTMLSEQMLSHEVTVRDPSKKTNFSVTRLDQKLSIMIIFNQNYGIENDAIASRIQDKTPTITHEDTKFIANISGLTPTDKDKKNEELFKSYYRSQQFCTAIFLKMIGTNTIPIYPELGLATFYWSKMLDTLKEHNPLIYNQMRTKERYMRQCFIKSIMDANDIVNSSELSPFTFVNPLNRSRSSQLYDINEYIDKTLPHMFAREESVIYNITSQLRQFYDPEIWNLFSFIAQKLGGFKFEIPQSEIQKIARSSNKVDARLALDKKLKKCKCAAPGTKSFSYSDIDELKNMMVLSDEPILHEDRNYFPLYQGNEDNFIDTAKYLQTTTRNNITLINPNWIVIKGYTMGTLASYLSQNMNRTGYDFHTIFYILKKACKIKHQCIPYDNIPSYEQNKRKKNANIKIPKINLADYSNTQVQSFPIIRFIKGDTPSKNEVRIFVPFLEQDPQSVLRTVLKSLCHKHTRERYVVIDMSVTGHTELNMLYYMKPSLSEFKIQNPSYVDPTSSKSFKNVAGVDNIEFDESTKNKFIKIHEDVEHHFARIHLKKLGITDPKIQEKYFQSSIDHKIKKLYEKDPLYAKKTNEPDFSNEIKRDEEKLIRKYKCDNIKTIESFSMSEWAQMRYKKNYPDDNEIKNKQKLMEYKKEYVYIIREKQNIRKSYTFKKHIYPSKYIKKLDINELNWNNNNNKHKNVPLIDLTDDDLYIKTCDEIDNINDKQVIDIQRRFAKEIISSDDHGLIASNNFSKNIIKRSREEFEARQRSNTNINNNNNNNNNNHNNGDNSDDISTSSNMSIFDDLTSSDDILIVSKEPPKKKRKTLNKQKINAENYQDFIKNKNKTRNITNK